jgi:hypothetical protein
MRLATPAALAAALMLAALPLAAEDLVDAALRESAISSYHPTTVGMVTDHDEERMQFQVSIQAPLLPLQGLGLGLDGLRLKSLNLGYDGLFDLYALTRYSQPLVSRVQNPGFFLLAEPGEGDEAMLRRLEAGWFHESNGQVIETKSQFDQAAAQGNASIAEDQVSRAWDYWHLASTLAWHPLGPALRLSLAPALRIYTGAGGAITAAEQDIFWRPQLPPSYISQYDGLRLRAAAEWGSTWRPLNYACLALDLRTGYDHWDMGQNVSERLTFCFKTWDLPWTAFYFKGYGPYPSDYSDYCESYGFCWSFQ